MGARAVKCAACDFSRRGACVSLRAMAKLVVDGATLACTMGAAPSRLAVLPTSGVEDVAPLATVMDFVPLTNLAPFGACRSTANPQVAMATAAAMGVLTPQPCLPVIPAPWSPGASGVTVGGLAALTDDSTCSCAWAGTVSFVDAGADALVTG